MDLRLVALVVCAGCLAPTPVGPGADDPRVGPVTAQAAAAWVAAAWGDAAEIVLVDDTFDVACRATCGGTRLYNPTALVLPGAVEVVVTAEWSAPFALRLAWEDAPSPDPDRAELASGEPFVIPLAPGDSDTPFQTASLWWFGFRPFEERPGLAAGDVRVHVVARRGSEPATPGPPPDPWAGAGTAAVVTGETATPGGPVCVPCAGTFWRPTGLVPPGTERLEATLAWEGTAAPELFAWEPLAGEVTMVLDADEAGRRTFTLPVDAGTTDSPYQPRSVWYFRAALATAGEPLALAPGDMTLDVVAVRAAG